MVLPEGWRVMQLGDLLPDEALQKIEKAFLLSNHEALHKRLVAILEPIKDDLLAKGVNHEYLAYAIEYKAKE